jgi:ElaA protein
MNLQWHTLSFVELDVGQLYAILRLRQEVFVLEQDCVYLDLDDRDQQAIHILCTEADRLLAYQRCIAPGRDSPESQLGRIVVRREARGRDLGRELVQRGIEHNRSRWPECDIRISAQAHLQDFYSSLGFNAEGREYLEDGIPHRRMRYQAPA